MYIISYEGPGLEEMFINEFTFKSVEDASDLIRKLSNAYTYRVYKTIEVAIYVAKGDSKENT